MKTCHLCGHQNPDNVEFCLACAATLGPQCPQCHQTVPPGNKFCVYCGASLEAKKACHNCGTVLPPGSKFCGQCGTRVVDESAGSAPRSVEASGQNAWNRNEAMLQSLRDLMPQDLANKMAKAARDIQGERREVTVLFLDTTNFTAVSHQMDSEDIYLIVDEAMRLLVDVVYKYEGTVDKFTGDGLMALFGAPVAHENDPERAVRAGLEMQSILQPLRERTRAEYGFDFQVRIGINTGSVVAGKLGSNLHMEYTVIGDTVNLASRLEGAAEPGTVLVSFSTYQRTRPLFKYKILPPVQLKGKPDPVPAYRPLGLRKLPGRVRGLPGLQVPMVGRQDALRQLQTAAEYVQRENKSQIVLVTGEAGLGKSRLVSEFRNTLAGQSISVYEGQCLSYARSTPLWVLATLVRNILGIAETDPQGLQVERLVTYLQQLGVNFDEVYPYLLNVLGLEQIDPLIFDRLSKQDVSMLQRQIHAALKHVFNAEAMIGPTVYIFEDLHWVDPASRNFLVDYLSSLTDLPILTILVSREFERTTVISPIISTLKKHPAFAADIQLQALSKEEELLLIGQLLDKAKANVPHLQARIAERTEGNPFYIEEIIRMLIDQGSLPRLGENGHTRADTDALLNSVPGTLKGLILARFDSLSDSLRQILQKAAVLGRSFPVRLVQALSSEAPSAVSVHLEELTTRQFLVEEPFGDEQGYSFRHALIQEAVYSTLLKKDRRFLHEQVAKVIRDGSFLPPDEKAEALAYHFGRSADPSQAIPYLLETAENATRRSAYETAIQHYRRAQSLLKNKSQEFEEEFYRIHIGLGQALKFSGEFAEARQVLRTSLERMEACVAIPRDVIPLYLENLRELADVCQREGDLQSAVNHLEAALSVADPENFTELWYTLLDRLAWVRFRQGQLEDAFTLASNTIRELEERDNDQPFTLASLYNTLGGIAWQQGNLAEAIPYVESSLRMYESQGYTWGIGVAYANLGVLHWALGNWTTAAHMYERAASLQSANGFLAEQIINLRNLGHLRRAMGEHEQAKRDFETTIELSRRLGHDYSILCGEIALALLALAEEKFEELETHLDAAEQYKAIADQDHLIQLQWVRAMLYAHRGQLELAEEIGESALAMANEAGLQEEQTDCFRTLGIIHRKAGRFALAERSLRDSVDLARQRKDMFREGQALLELGTLYAQAVHPDNPEKWVWHKNAVDTILTAIERFEQVGAVRELARARRLHDEIAPLARGNDPSGQLGLRNDMPDRSPDLPGAKRYRAAILWLNLRTISVFDSVDEEELFEQTAVLMPELIRICYEHQAELIRRPDGLTVVFGAPQTHEDDLERAVKAALQISRYLENAVDTRRTIVKYSIGISAGDVVAGYLDRQAKSNFVVTGNAVLLAQQIAESGTSGHIWVSQSVRSETERIFVYRSVEQTQSGYRLSFPVFELTDVCQEPGEKRGLPGLQAKLVGRDSYLQAMNMMCEYLENQRGGFIWVQGEAGIGKSRLLKEFASQRAGESAIIWSGQCTLQSSRQAFSLFSNILANVFGFRATDSTRQKRSKILEQLKRWPAEIQDLQAHLELLCGIPVEGRGAKHLADLEPDQLRQQLFVAVRTLVNSVAQQRPLIIMMDDLHWIDPMSAQLLMFLAFIVNSAPVLFVCAHRHDENGDAVDELAAVRELYPQLTLQIHLSRLSDDESAELLKELLPNSTIAPDVRSFVLERSEGNPYYIEEFLRLLIERGYLREIDNHWVTASGIDLELLPLPTSLEALIRSRVDNLPAELRQQLQYAAVIGRPFKAALLTEVTQRHDVPSVLERLQERGILQTSETEDWEFNHNLAQLVVYNSMLKVQRKALHLRVAEILEEQWDGSEDEHASELAYHFTAAGNDEKALRYLVIAGERAAARYANEEALEHFRRAKEIISRKPEADINVRWRIAVGLGDVYRFVGKYKEATAALSEGLQLLNNKSLTNHMRAGLYRRLGETAQRQGEPELAYDYYRQALVCLEEPSDQPGQIEAARTLHGLAWTHFYRGQLEKAQEAAGLVRLYAEQSGSLNELATAENLLGGIYYRLGEWELAMQHTAKAMAWREEMGYTWGVAATLSNMGILASASGDLERAESYFLQSLARRQELGDVEGVVIVHVNLGWLTKDQGRLTKSMEHFQASLAIAEPAKMIYHAANSLLGLAQVHLLKGNYEIAQQMNRRSLELAQRADAKDLVAEIYRLQAEIQLQQADLVNAEKTARLAADLANGIGSRNMEAAAWRIVSECQTQRNDLAGAEQSLVRAEQAIAETPDELETGRLERQKARVAARKQDFESAQAHLTNALKIFRRLGAKLELELTLATQPDLLHYDSVGQDA